MDGATSFSLFPDETTVLLGEAMREWSGARQLELMRDAINVLVRPRGTAAPDNYRDGLPFCLFWRTSPHLEELRQQERRGAFKVDKRRLRREIENHLVPLLGAPPSENGGAVRHVTRLTEVTVYTDIDFSPRAPAKVTYEQIVVAGAVDAGVGYFDPSVLLTGMSLFNLLGTTATRWSFITNDDVPRVADTLSQLCKDWLDAIPHVVEAARARPQ